MRMSMQVDKIAAALVLVNKNAPAILKTKTVKVVKQGRDLYSFDYAPLEEILSEYRPLLATNGLSFVQSLGYALGEAGPIGVLSTTLLHTSGQWVSDEQAYSLEGTSQDIGARITYMRRYAIVCMVCTASEDDVDGDDSNEKTVTNKKPAKSAPIDWGKITELPKLVAAFNKLDKDGKTEHMVAFQARRSELLAIAEVGMETGRRLAGQIQESRS